ncbi:hypothetical protein GCM10007063_31440 [Lentibacillus kapialis]|uniref:Tetratricopeptide repeat protein n=1 Tax=Lentibacillus kapialis TaxID=340214 RepID=A0A917Q1V2_9BACI|nr:hypothetical protein [Lentibacillus kapialis]GGK06570.1 hypothetical protein GCM10007063_31440 [Lentibacillus kapialis]
MKQNQFDIYRANGKPLHIYPQRIALYHQAKIIEAVSDNHDMYYLFFYRQDFLTAAKAKKLRRHSFIESAFKQGIVFNAPHPFVEELFSTNNHYRIIRFAPLLKKLDKHYTPQEKAYILTFFESFISKKRLFNEIKSVFYIYRRKGQNVMAYQIVRVFMDFAPKHDFVRQLRSDLNFKRYAAMYHNQSEEILKQDVIFAEKVFYSKITNDTYFQQLINLLHEQSRWMDLTALYCAKLIRDPSEKYYDPLTNLLTRYLENPQIMHILEDLHCTLTQYTPLKQDLLKQYIKLNKLEHVLNMFDDPELELNTAQTASIREMLEQLDPGSQSLSSEQLQSLFKITIDCHPNKAEELIHEYTSALLKEQEPLYIRELLQPFADRREVHLIYQKVNRLITFNDDLDQMQMLGELYYEFSRTEQAIECFSWEMELKPDDPTPLKWLAKIYQELGMEQESKAYRQLLSNLQKRA